MESAFAPAFSPPPLLPKQSLRPLRIVGSKSRFGVLAVVDIVTVAARLVAFVDQRLQVKRDVGVSPAEGNPNGRQALAEGNSVILDLKRFPAPAGARGVGGALALGDAVHRSGEDTAAGPQQIDLDQTDTPSSQLLLLLYVQVFTGAGKFVRWAEHLDHGHDAPARLDIDDLDVPLPDRLGLFQVDHKRLGHRNAVSRDDSSFAWPATLNNPHVRNDVPALPLGRLDEDALVHSGNEVAGQSSLQRPACKGNKRVMNIAPELLEVRVHTGKGTAHGRNLRWLGLSTVLILTQSPVRSSPDLSSPAA